MDGMEVMPRAALTLDDISNSLAAIDAASSVNKEVVESDPALSLLVQTITSLRDEGRLSVDAQMAADKLLPMLANTDKAERSFAIVMADFLKDFEFIKVDAFESVPQLYVWYRSTKEDSDLVFRPLSEPMLREVLTDYYIRNKQGCLAPKISAAADTLRNRVPYHIREISNRIIKVSKDYFFDTQTAKLHKRLEGMLSIDDNSKDTIDGKPVCFRSLFDSPGDKDEVPISSISFQPYELNVIDHYLRDHDGEFAPPDAFVNQIEDYYNDETLPPEQASYLKEIHRQSVKKFHAPLNFFWVAADYNVGRYNDMIKTFMLEFQYVKFGYFFYFIGEKVNGKSAMQRCRHLLLGTANTASLSAPKLCSWDHSLDLALAMSNAPSEDSDFKKDEVDSALEMLKCMATHEKIVLRMKNHAGGIPFTPNFLSFFPRNKIPDFGSSDGLQAFVSRRIKIIHFTHDFSAESNNGRDFVKETFTPKFYSALLPLLLGSARYHLGKGVKFSQDSEAFATKMGEIMDPATHFLNRLFYWFDYAGPAKFITDQAKKYFIDHGVSDWKEKLDSIRDKMARLNEERPRYLGRKQIAGSPAYEDQNLRSRCKACPAVFEEEPGGRVKRKRLDVFSPDAKLAVLGGRSPSEYYSSLNPDDVDGNDAHSIITILDDFESDDAVKKDPVQMQLLMETKK